MTYSPPLARWVQQRAGFDLHSASQWGQRQLRASGFGGVLDLALELFSA